MRTVRWPVTMAMVLATAALAAGQETQKEAPARDRTRTIDRGSIGIREVRGGDGGATGPEEVEHSRLARIHRNLPGFIQPDDAAVLSQLVRSRALDSDDPHRDVILRLRNVATDSCTQCHAGGVSVKKDEALGLTLVPADETLRSQLKLDRTGLVVTEVAKGSAGEAGGIEEKDILVALAGKPLTDVESFTTALRESGATAKAAPEPGVGPVGRTTVLTLVRAGRPLGVALPPPGPPTLVVGQVAKATEPTKAPGYWIGVQIGEVDDTLRSHLKLGEGVGLVFTDVLKDTPAEKAGLKKDDILISINGTAVKSSDDMIKAVQESKGGPLKLQIRRAGEIGAYAVRPEKRRRARDDGPVGQARRGPHRVRPPADVGRPGPALHRQPGEPDLRGGGPGAAGPVLPLEHAEHDPGRAGQLPGGAERRGSAGTGGRRAEEGRRVRAEGDRGADSATSMSRSSGLTRDCPRSPN